VLNRTYDLRITREGRMLLQPCGRASAGVPIKYYWFQGHDQSLITYCWDVHRDSWSFPMMVFFHHVSGPFWDASSLRHSYWWWVVRGDSCRWRHVTPQIYISTLRAAAGLDRICWVTFVIIGLCRTQCWGWL